MINIDLAAVGRLRAERNNVVYGSYQEPAGHPLVYDMIGGRNILKRPTARSPRIPSRRARRCGASTDFAQGASMPTTAKVTRTQKVRRGFVAQRVTRRSSTRFMTARRRPTSPAEVTFEDGRKGVRCPRGSKSATWRRSRSRRHSGKRHEGAIRSATLPAGESPFLSRKRVAVVRRRTRDSRRLVRHQEGRSARAIIGPNGAGKTSMLNVINEVSTTSRSKGRITFKGETRSKMQPHEQRRPWRHRAHLPECRAVQGHEPRSTTSWPAAP